MVRFLDKYALMHLSFIVLCCKDDDYHEGTVKHTRCDAVGLQ